MRAFDGGRGRDLVSAVVRAVVLLALGAPLLANPVAPVTGAVSAAAAPAALVSAAPVTVPLTTAVPEADCEWRMTAVLLARALDGIEEPRAAQLRAALAGQAITPSSTPPAGCGDGPPRPAAPAKPAPVAPTPVAVPSGGTRVCDTFGSAPVDDGRYEVQNNVWGSELPQCVRAFDTGFAVEDAQFTNTNGPASYPSIFTGCHYGTCTAGTSLPRQVSALPTVTSSWSFTGTRADQQWDAAYDIWFDPTARRDGTVTGTEMMIWLDATDPKPIGEKTATVDLGGITWEVWRGVNGAQVISYVATTPTHQVQDLPLSTFFADAVTRGVVRPDWYLTSVQAGFEPWTGGAGLTTTAFSVTGVTG